MVNLTIIIPVVVGVVTLGGFIVRFFQMQTKQNLKIEQVEKVVKTIIETDIPALERKLSEQAHYQIDTEKAVVQINTKLDAIMVTLTDLKNGRA